MQAALVKTNLSGTARPFAPNPFDATKRPRRGMPDPEPRRCGDGCSITHTKRGIERKKIAPGVQFRVLKVSVVEMVGKGRDDGGVGDDPRRARAGRLTLHGENLAHDRIGSRVGMRDMSLGENHARNSTTVVQTSKHELTGRKRILGIRRRKSPGHEGMRRATEGGGAPAAREQAVGATR